MFDLQLTVKQYNGKFKLRDIVTIVVKDTTKYLLTDLKPASKYSIEVKSYTATGSSSQTAKKDGKTNKIPTVTGMINPNTQIS